MITLNGDQFEYLLPKRFDFGKNLSCKYPNWSLKRRINFDQSVTDSWLDLTGWLVISDQGWIVLMYGISYAGNTFILHRIQPLGYIHIFMLKTYVINLKDIDSAKWVFPCNISSLLVSNKNPIVWIGWTSGSPHMDYDFTMNYTLKFEGHCSLHH